MPSFRQVGTFLGMPSLPRRFASGPVVEYGRDVVRVRYRLQQVVHKRDKQAL